MVNKLIRTKIERLPIMLFLSIPLFMHSTFAFGARPPKQIPGAIESIQAKRLCINRGGIKITKVITGKSVSVCTCEISGESIGPYSGNGQRDCRAAEAELIGAQLKGFNSREQYQRSCGLDPIFAADDNNHLTCPKFFRSLLMDDRRSSWFGLIESPNESCKTVVDRTFDGPQGAEKLEAYLASELNFDIDAPPNLITRSGCLSNNWEVRSNRSHGKIKISKKSITEEEQKAAVAEYYSGMLRLRQGSLALIEGIASIDSVLGTKNGKLLAGTDCENPHLRDTFTWCSKFQSCKTTKGRSATFYNMVNEGKRDLELLTPYYEERKRASRAGDKKQVEEIDKSIEKLSSVIHSFHPWSNGKEVKKIVQKIKEGKSKGSAIKLAEGISRQLETDRKAMVDRLAKFKTATSCLNNETHVSPSDCKNLDSILASAPAYIRVPIEKDDPDKLKKFIGNYYLDQASCRRAIRGAKDEANGAIKSFGEGLAITALTLGLGSVAAAGRTAIVAAKSGSQATGLALKARVGYLATAALGITDGSFAYQGIKATENACDELLEQLSIQSGVDYEKGPQSCPNSITRTSVEADYKACRKARLLGYTLAALPTVSGGLRLASNRVAVSAAKKASGLKSLSKQQTKAIMTARALPWEQKASTLSEAFGRDNQVVKKILESGAAGKLPKEPGIIKRVLLADVGGVGKSLRRRPKVTGNVKFISLDDIYSSSNKNPILLLDSPGEFGKALPDHIKALDHHGPYRNAARPNQNTTSKLVDAYETAAKRLPKGTNPVKIHDEMIRDLLELPPGTKIPNPIPVATDNLGDAMVAMYLINHPGSLATKESRSAIRLMTFHEDFGHFGSKLRNIAKKSPKAAKSVEQAHAAMQVFDDIIIRAKQDPRFAGAFKGSDRFNGIPEKFQKIIVEEAQSGLEGVMTSPQIRKQLAQQFEKNLESARKQVAQTAMVKRNDPFLAGVRKLDAAKQEAFDQSVAVIDSSKIAPRGQFANWGGVSTSHNKPYQVQILRLGKDKFGYIIAVPNGAKNLGILDDSLLKELKGLGGGNFTLRDSGLLFNFAGDNVPPEQVLAVLAKHLPGG